MIEPSRFEEELAPTLRWHFRQADEDCCDQEMELARYAAGDLSPEEQPAFETHLAGCHECRSDLARYQAEIRLDGLERPTLWRRLRAVSWRRPFEIRALRWAAAGVAAAVAVAVAVILVSPRERDTLQIKGRGAFELQVAGARGGRTFRVGDGTKLTPGDQLGFFYSAPTSGYLLIAHADEREVVRIFPAASRGSAPVAAGREVGVPDGAVLSSGRGCEWIVGLFSHRPLDEGEASQIVRNMVAERRGCHLGAARAKGVETSSIGVRQ